MTAGNIAHRTTARPARKPEPSRVVQSYLHIVSTQGKRGACRKTGEIYGISRETVRRYVAAHEASRNAPEEPPELQYVPPPGGYPTPQPMAQIGADWRNTDASICTEAAQNDVENNAELMSSEKCTNDTGPQESTNCTAETAHDETAQLHSDELEPPMVAAFEIAQPVIIRQRVVIREREPVGLVAWVREHPGAAHQAVAWVIAAVLIGVASLGG